MWLEFGCVSRSQGLIEGIFTDRAVRNRKERFMRAIVDAEVCTGCEQCTETCPEVFQMDGDVAVVKVEVVPAEVEDSARQAADECPVEAITIE